MANDRPEPTGSTQRKLARTTRLSHVGTAGEELSGFVNPPVVHGSTVLFPDMDTARHGRQRYRYGRRGNPTNDALEALCSDLEGAEGTALFPSGASACAMALSAVTKAGDRVVVVDNVYNPTRAFSDNVLKRFGVEIVYVDPLDHDAIAESLRTPTAALFLEAPGSLTFEMPDVPAIAAMGKAAGAKVLIDNTWATPLFFRPLEHGCDLVIHAATKYFGGHSDLLLGTVSGNGEALKAVRDARGYWGIHVGPDDVYDTLRGMRTMDVRLQRHQHNARIVAEWLDANPKVKRVLYPALPSHPGHAIWARDYDGASGLFGFTVDGDQARADRLVDALSLFGIGYSWGGYESLATVPTVNACRSATMWPQDEWVVRLSIGLEDPADLIADLETGLAAMDA